jgi:hypothetical protein
VLHLGVQLGKDSIIRLLNLDDLSGQGGPGHTAGELQQISGLGFVPHFSSQPTVWVDPDTDLTWLFTVNNGAAYGFVLHVDSRGNPGFVRAWSRTNYGGSSAVVADGLLVYAEQSPHLVALNARTGEQVWSAPISLAHWASPIVADGQIFFADAGGTLQAYSAPGAFAHSNRPLPSVLLLPRRRASLPHR